MLLERLQTSPIRALIWIEAIAFGLAFAGDLIIGLKVPVRAPLPLAPHVPLYALVMGITAAAAFRIPHAPNRRYASIIVASLGLAVSGMIPTIGGTPFVLLMILASRLTFAFGLRGAVLVWFVALLAIVANAAADLYHGAGRYGHFDLASAAVVTYVFSLQNALIVGIIGMMWIYARKAASSAAMSERMRIALDLHDSLGHGLSTLAVQLQNAERMEPIDPAKAREYVRRAGVTTAQILGDVRETVSMLHDDERAPEPSFALFLERLRSEFSAAHGVNIAWNVGVRTEPSGRITMAVYRVLQEALTNIARHAEASKIDVDVEGRSDWIEVRIRDDGRGFSAAPGGHGLLSMRTRVESAGGTFALSSAPGMGTQIVARIPLEAAS